MPDPKTRVTLTLDDQADADAVLANARKTGFKLEKTLTFLNMLVGVIDTAKIAQLARIEGVQAAEPEQTFHTLPERENQIKPSRPIEKSSKPPKRSPFKGGW